jgi:Protein of unknown function (DUF1592)/Protein of unknown function (DUF1588)/Protein of unknown function (DUF1587)/Protein of unknown function (DUF1595)/Protein of unknown function (DUF1585)
MLSRTVRVGWQLGALALGCAACSSESTNPVGPQPGPGQTAGTGGSSVGTGGAGAGAGAGTGGVVSPEECKTKTAILPGDSPVRRLNRFEYDNTVRDLLGDTSRPASAFPLEEQSSFDNDATVLRVSRLLAESYLSAAESLADKALANAATLPCAATAATGDMAVQEQCAGTLIDTLGKRTYRRPVSAEERTRLLGVFRSAREFLDFKESASTMLETMLMSPQFLYRLEKGTAVDGNPGVLKVDGWGLASRLSYFLWGTMPDDDLLQAAEEGRLSVAADVKREAERMFTTEKSGQVIRHFTRHWLELTTVDQQGKDAALFPDYTPAIGTLMRTQTETFAQHMYLEPGGTLGGLLSAPYTYMNQSLAKFMGVAGPTTDQFERVELDPKKHAGVLTEPAFLSYNATVDGTHPILRGVFVMRKLLCAPPPDPPPGVVDGTKNAPENATQRERLALHRTNETCNGCHKFIDPIGLSFENFDAVGRWRDAEASGAPVDATGSLLLSDVDGPVANAIELSQKLAQSPQVAQCIAVNWFRYANGRGESAADTCSVLQVKDALAAANGDLRTLVLSQTQTDAFLYRNAPEVMP